MNSAVVCCAEQLTSLTPKHSVRRYNRMLPSCRALPGMTMTTAAAEPRAHHFTTGYIGEPECFGVKLVSLFRATNTALSSHLGLVLLLKQSRLPRGLLDAAEITAIRTPRQRLGHAVVGRARRRVTSRCWAPASKPGVISSHAGGAHAAANSCLARAATRRQPSPMSKGPDTQVTIERSDCARAVAGATSFAR